MFDSGRSYFLGRSHIRLAPLFVYHELQHVVMQVVQAEVLQEQHVPGHGAQQHLVEVGAELHAHETPQSDELFVVH